MKKLWLAIALLFATPLYAVDLPTVTVEHLYYLQTRAEHVRKFKPDEMIDYCVAQKIGGAGFEYLYSQLFNVRIELAKLIVIGEAESTDPRVVSLNKTRDAYSLLLQEEAQRVQYGIVLEGQIASDTLQTITRAQSGH